MCETCAEFGEQQNCPSCRANFGATAFPFNRNDYDFGRIWAMAWERFQQEWLMLGICALVLMGASILVSLFGQVFQGIAGAVVGKDQIIVVAVIGAIMQQVISGLVQGVVQLGLFRVAIDVLQGRKADISRLFSQVNKLGRYILMYLTQIALIGIPVAALMGGMLLLSVSMSGATSIESFFRHGIERAVPLMMLGFIVILVPLIYVSLGLIFAAQELMYGDCGPIEALKRSWEITSGHRLPVFGYSLMAGLVVLVGVIACCVGVLPAMGLAQLLLSGLYLSLRQGSNLPPPPEP